MNHPTSPRAPAFALIPAISLLFGPALAAPTTPAPANYTDVRAFIQQGIRDSRAPSVAVAVIKADRVIWAEGFGLADLETNRPATADSVYLLASVSKPVTATGLMLLVDQGKIDLNRPANDYLPGAKLTARAGDAGAITVRRLLNHTGGLPVHANFFHDGTSPPSRDETIRRHGFAHTVPGSRWEYCNLAFGVIDHITATTAKMPWGKFMEANLYDPLGMAHTSDHVRPGVARDATTQYRYDVAGRFIKVPPYGFDHDGASIVWSSANDLTRFLRLHLNDGVLDGKRHFQPGTLRAMQAFSVARSPDQPETGYGLGFFVEPHLGQRSFGHSGGMPGVATRIRAFPDHQAGYVVLLNASAYGSANAASFREEICERLTRALLPGTTAGPVPERRDAKPAAKPGSFAGRWRGAVAHFDGDIPLALAIGADGTARATFGAQPPVRLTKVSFANRQFTGEMPGVINTQPGYHGVTTLEFRLRESDGSLTGLCVAAADGYFALSHWVALKRET